MSDCVFCRIRDREIPSMTIYEDDRTLCIMDINPLTAGHCLVITRSHEPTLFDCDPINLEAAIRTAQKVALALRATLQPDGINLMQANGAAAFQSVPHFHLHVIPRWSNDGKGFDWSPVPGDRGQIAATGDKIRAALEES
jgi:histidine triad (HIT) family protein